MERQGKALGGGSAINGALYLRPDTREFEAFEALGAKGWYACLGDGFDVVRSSIGEGRGLRF